MVSQFRPDWCFYSPYLDTLEMHLNRHCLTYHIVQRCTYIGPNEGGFQRVLRLLGTLFGDGDAYIVYTGEGTGLPSALLQGKGMCLTTHPMRVPWY